MGASMPTPRLASDGVLTTVCAWCRRYGQPHGALRRPSGAPWQAVSHAQVQAIWRASTTSHGICPWCAPRFAAECAS